MSADRPLLGRIDDYVFHYARLYPEREALVLDDQRFTYRAVAAAVQACADGLIRLGVGKGDRVVMLSTPRPEYLIVFLATIHVGGIWLGLNPRYQRRELLPPVADSRPKVLVSMTDIEGRDYRPDIAALRTEVSSIEMVVSLGGTCEGAVSYESLLEQAPDTPAEQARKQANDAVRSADTALLVYTSGTTGQPKGVMLRHSALINRARVRSHVWYVDHPRIINYLPISHMAGTCFLSLYALIGGGTIVFRERFLAEEIPVLIERERINALIQVPTAHQLVCAQPEFSQRDLSSLSWAIWSGSAIGISTLERLEGLGVELAVSYGLTESSGGVVYSRAGLDLETLTRTIGHPNPPGVMRLIGENGTTCHPGEQGEIQVHPENVMVGYFNRPKETAEAFTADGWLKTGDVAHLEEDGSLRFVGRLSERYKSGGYNINPREIEIAIEEHPSVVQAAVIGVPDPLYQEVGCVFVVAKVGNTLTDGELRDWCRARMANYKVPKHFYVRAELPLLPIGKVDKRALKSMHANT